MVKVAAGPPLNVDVIFRSYNGFNASNAVLIVAALAENIIESEIAPSIAKFA